MFKFLIRATRVPKSCHAQPYKHSVQNDVSSRKGKVHAVVSRDKVCDKEDFEERLEKNRCQRTEFIDVTQQQVHT
jgi:hypothetical protein